MYIFLLEILGYKMHFLSFLKIIAARLIFKYHLCFFIYFLKIVNDILVHSSIYCQPYGSGGQK